MPEHDDDLARHARALDFHWRVPDDLVAAASLPKFSRSKINRAMASVLAALALAADSDRPYVSYSRSRDFYTAQGRYEGTDYTYASVLQAVDELGRLGLIEEIRSKPGAHLTHGMQSRMRASDRLVEILAGQPVEYLGSRCPLVLKDADGSRIDYEDTPETRRLTREIGGLNRYLNTFSVDISALASPDDWQRTAHHIRARKLRDGVETWACARVTPQVQVYRVMSRGTWCQGGRIYGGWWEGLPKDRRLELLINGEVCIEQDFASIHPRLLYAMRGERIPSDFDCYVLPYYERWVGKLALNIAINAATLNAAAGALMEKGPEEKADGSPVWPYGWAETRRIIDQVIAHNPAIAGYIGSDAGVSLMAIDSRMALDVLKACEKAELPALPVHDSFLAPEGRQGGLKTIMSDVLEETLDRISPSLSKGSKKDLIGETIQMIRYRESVPVDASLPEAGVAPSAEPGALPGTVVVSTLPEAEVAFRPVVRVPAPRPVASLRTLVAPVPEAVVAPPAVPEPAPCPEVVPVPVATSAPRVAVPAFLRALLPPPEAVPAPSPEPLVPVAQSRRRSSLSHLVTSLPPADIGSETVSALFIPAAPEPIVVPSDLALVEVFPEAVLPAPVPAQPMTREERRGALAAVAALSRERMDLDARRRSDHHMAALRSNDRLRGRGP